jgi:GT2 family glycosyltransferase
MMMAREVFERIGQFREEYFMFAEDVDLCWESVRAGYVNYYSGDGVVIHHGGKSSTDEWAIPATWKANLRFYRRTNGWLYTLMFRAVMGTVAILRIVLLAVLPRAAKRFCPDESEYPASRKWRAILKVLLTESARLSA